MLVEVQVQFCLVMSKIFGVKHLFPLKLTLMNLKASVKNNIDSSGSNDFINITDTNLFQFDTITLNSSILGVESYFSTMWRWTLLIWDMRLQRLTIYRIEVANHNKDVFLWLMLVNLVQWNLSNIIQIFKLMFVFDPYSI